MVSEMPGNRNVISETVVSLQADIDNAGIDKLLGLLDVNKMKAFALSGALAAVTSGVFKFIEGITKQEYELEKLAKKQQKTIEDTRAEEMALKQMGMTLDEIEKDGALQSMYDDLVKFNKEMEMPNMQRALGNVRKLQTEFYKLKSALQNALTAIANQVLVNLEAPMDRVGGKLKSAAEWIRDNLTPIATKIGSFITAFVKGVVAIADVVGKIVGWIADMPDGIKGIALAISAVFLLLKSGPLGQILTVVTAIGDIIHDFENFQWNKNNALNPEYWAADNEQGWTTDASEALIDPETGEKIAYQIDTAFGDLWEIVADETKDTRTKARDVFGKLLENITGGLQDAINTFNSGEDDGLRGWLSSALGPVGDIFGGIVDYVSNNPEQIQQFVSSLFSAIASALKKVGEIGVDITGSVAELVASIFGGVEWESVWANSDVNKFLQKDNAFATGLATAVETALVGGDFITSIITGAISGYQEAKENALRALYEADTGLDASDILYTDLEEMYKDDDRVASQLAEGLQSDFNDMINGVLEILTAGITIVGDVSSGLLKKILLGIFGSKGTVADALGAVSEDNPIFKSLSTGIATWIASGDFWIGLVGAIVQMINSTETVEELEKAADEMVEMFVTLWDGAWIDEADHSKGRNGRGLHTFLKRIWEGEDGEGGIKSFFVTLGEKIIEWLTPVFIKLGDILAVAFYNALDAAGLLGTLEWLGISVSNPNTSSISQDEDGNFVLKSTNGRTKVLTSEELARINGGAGQVKSNSALTGFNEDTVFNFSINDKGEVVVTNYDKSDDEFKSDRRLVTGGSNGSWTDDGNPYFFTLWHEEDALKRDIELKKQELEENKRNYEEQIRNEEEANAGTWVKVEGGGTYDENGGLAPDEVFVPNGDESIEVVPEVDVDAIDEQLNSGKFTVEVEPRVTGSKGGFFGGKAAMGGRIGHEMNNMTVGEDGTEYIIPITKPERAFSLINQMLSEMGSSAIRRVVEGFGIGESGSVGSSPENMASALQGMTMANTYNITAPVNINVNASGASGKEIGTSIYDVAERHLIRTLKGVVA